MPASDRPDEAKRLTEARIARGFEKAKDAATFFGWKYSTYSQHERGERGLSKKAAEKYGKAFRRTVGWLLAGEERARESPPAELPASPAVRPQTLPIMGYIGAGAIIEPEFEQVPPEGLDQIELPFAVPPDLIGLEVRGDSMLPRYESGDVIIVWREPHGTAEILLGEEAAVRTARGQRYLKRLLRGASRGTFNLESTNATAKTIEGVRLDWWSEVYLTVRAAQLRRIGARERARQRAQSQRRDAAATAELPLPVEPRGKRR